MRLTAKHKDQPADAFFGLITSYMTSCEGAVQMLDGFGDRKPQAIASQQGAAKS
jgi:hypothetical protein